MVRRLFIVLWVFMAIWLGLVGLFSANALAGSADGLLFFLIFGGVPALILAGLTFIVQPGRFD